MLDAVTVRSYSVAVGSVQRWPPARHRAARKRLVATVASIHGIPELRGLGRRADRSARVFVDDATLGTVPFICVKSGEPADGMLPIRTSLRRFNPLWLLLILLGPIGWIVLVLVALRGDSGEAFESRLPMTVDVMDRYVRSRRRLSRAWTALFVGVIALPVALVVSMGTAPAGGDPSPGPPALVWVLLGLVGLGLVAFMAHAWLESRYTNVDIELDASRRWVTLHHVSPEFADAVHARDRHPATLPRS